DQMQQLAQIRQQEEDATRVVFSGTGFCRSFTPGYQFELESVGDGVASTFDGKYTLVAISHRASESYGADEAADLSYHNDFECIEADVPYCPPRRTPPPVIHGIQTAVVVGPGGEEIYVDKYGRVKLHFHWDRLDKWDENSSCWVRVAQDWAGKNWGIVSLPRI